MKSPKKITVQTLQDMKQASERIAMLTAYDFFSARMFDAAGVDILLVGDTVGMTLGGHETTLSVSLEQIMYHAEMVSRGVERSLVVGDMPFLTYQVTIEAAVENAGHLMQQGKVHAVKLEGGRTMVPVVKRILRAGIPVMGHLGLTPQSVHKFGGWRVQGKDAASAERLREASKALEDAGCFAIVLEAIPADLANEITQSVEIPTIGIGAGPRCDGQVLTSPDMLGITDFKAKYVKQYANLKQDVIEAVKAYVDDVKNGEFPTDDLAY